MTTSDQALRDMGIDPAKAAAFRQERAQQTETFHKVKRSIEDGARQIHSEKRHVGSFETCDECRADLQSKIDAARDSIVHRGRFEGPEKSRERRQEAKRERRR